MASEDDKACSSTETVNVDTPIECDTVQIINAQFPKIDNLQHFPEKVLYHIFSMVNDNDLLHLSDTSYRFESIARTVFKEKYEDEYFVFQGESDREMYEELFSRFGQYADIKAVEVRFIHDIPENHWLIQLLRQHTNRLQKMTFDGGYFDNIGNILSEHTHIEHLILDYVDSSPRIVLPNYRNLKKLKMSFVFGYQFANLTQTIRNNPALESLILVPRYDSSKFHDVMMMIARNSKNLTELHLGNFKMRFSRFSDNDMDLIIDSLKNLQTLSLNVTNGELELIQGLGSACKSIKHLELGYYHDSCGGYESGDEGDDDRNFSDAMIDALGRFTTIEQFELSQKQYNDRIEYVVGQMPNLRHLDLRMCIPESSTFILSLLHSCPAIETITIQTYSDVEPKFFVNVQFWNEFNEVMQHPNGIVKLKVNEATVGYATKKEIVWNKMVMHWFEYDWEFNATNVTLLDLAKPSAASVAAEVEQKPTPFDHILGYLDLASLYSMSAASEHSKQLVESYVKRHAHRNGTFIISDEFHHDAEGLDAYAEHVQNLKVEILHPNFCNHLDAIAEQYVKLSELSIHSRWPTYSRPEVRYVFPQARHLIADEHYSHLCQILTYYPKLETLKTKSNGILDDCCLEPLAIYNLKKFTFKYRYESELEEVREIFEETSTELIPIPK